MAKDYEGWFPGKDATKPVRAEDIQAMSKDFERRERLGYLVDELRRAGIIPEGTKINLDDVNPKTLIESFGRRFPKGAAGRDRAEAVAKAFSYSLKKTTGLDEGQKAIDEAVRKLSDEWVKLPKVGGTPPTAAAPPVVPPTGGVSPPVEPPTQGKPPAGVEDAPTKPIKFPEQPPPLRLVNEGGPPISFAEGQRRRGLEAALGSSRRGRAQGLQAKASASPVPIPDTVPPVPDVPTTAYGRAVGGLKSLVGGVVADESAILADAGALASKGKLLSATGKLASGGLGSLLLGGLISGSGERAASLYGAATTPTPEAGDIYNTIKAQEIIKRRMREALMSNPELSGALRSQLQAQQINERGYTPNEVQLGGGPQFDDPQGLANFLGV